MNEQLPSDSWVACAALQALKDLAEQEWDASQLGEIRIIEITIKCNEVP